MKNLLEACGYNIVNDVLPITSELPDVNEKNTNDRLMFITNGNPRYTMCDFLVSNHFGSMKTEHEKQY